MKGDKQFDVIIIGGSYAGLSAALALGRALRNVLVIDSGMPCNRQTPHSHNFLTQDGKPPSDISGIAKQQLQQYKTVSVLTDLATGARKMNGKFEIDTQGGQTFTSRKLIFATGIKDLLPEIGGFAECWGISLIHCPYCHGYEVRNEKTGIIGNGNMGYEMAKLISNWTRDLTLFTNGQSSLTPEQTEKLTKFNISIIEKEIGYLEHDDGYVTAIVFKDGSSFSLKAIYFRAPFEQHCPIPSELGCEMTESGHIKVDASQKTNVPGIYACGDNSMMMRSVSGAVYSGSFAGALVNKEIIEETFT